MNTKRLPQRFLVYIIGIFFLAFSVTLSVSCNLGTIAGNMLCYILSVVCNKPLSTFTTIIFFVYVFLQFLILRKDFKPIYILELAFTVVFGYFVGITTAILGKWIPGSYFEQLVQMFLSLVFTGLGVSCYVNVDLVPMPPEAFSLAIIFRKPSLTMGKVRTVQDIITVVVSLAISLICTGGIHGFREGTVITALLSGFSIDFFNKRIGKYVRRFCLNETQEEA